jgi:hypothetical protein
MYNFCMCGKKREGKQPADFLHTRSRTVTILCVFPLFVYHTCRPDCTISIRQYQALTTPCSASRALNRLGFEMMAIRDPWSGCIEDAVASNLEICSPWCDARSETRSIWDTLDNLQIWHLIAIVVSLTQRMAFWVLCNDVTHSLLSLHSNFEKSGCARGKASPSGSPSSKHLVCNSHWRSNTMLIAAVSSHVGDIVQDCDTMDVNAIRIPAGHL